MTERLSYPKTGYKHHHTLSKTLTNWSDSEPDACLVSREGDKIFTHRIILHFYSNHLSSIISSLPSSSSVISFSVDASSASISFFLGILCSGQVASDNIKDLVDVKDIANMLGIHIDNCCIETKSNARNIAVKEEDSTMVIVTGDDINVQTLVKDDTSACIDQEIEVKFCEEISTDEFVSVIKDEISDVMKSSRHLSDSEDDFVNDSSRKQTVDIEDNLRNHTIGVDDDSSINHKVDIDDSSQPTCLTKVDTEDTSRNSTADTEDSSESLTIAGQDDIICPQCDEMFRDKSKHVQHYRESHCSVEEENIICIKCQKYFEGVSALSHHIYVVHSRRREDVKYCDQCELTFETRKLLRRHIKTIHEDIKNVACDLCGKKFRDNYGLRRHTKEKHKNRNQQILIENLKGRKQLNACPLCQKKIKRLNWHLKGTHGVNKNMEPIIVESKYQCKFCDKKMRDSSNLKRHEIHHQKLKERIVMKIFKTNFESN